jgi:hypothetical protein
LKVKITVKNVVIPVPKHHTIKTYREAKVKLPTLLTMALNGGKWSVSHSGHWQKNTSHPLDKRLDGLQSRSLHGDKEKNPKLSLPRIEPRSSSP